MLNEEVTRWPIGRLSGTEDESKGRRDSGGKSFVCRVFAKAPANCELVTDAFLPLIGPPIESTHPFLFLSQWSATCWFRRESKDSYGMKFINGFLRRERPVIFLARNRSGCKVNFHGRFFLTNCNMNFLHMKDRMGRLLSSKDPNI